MQLLFCYGVLTNKILSILLERMVNTTDFVMKNTKEYTGLDGFTYVVTDFGSSASGVLIDVSSSEVERLGEWYGTLYKKAYHFDSELHELIIYFTYVDPPALERREYIELQGNLGRLSEDDIQQLAVDFVEYYRGNTERGEENGNECSI